MVSNTLPKQPKQTVLRCDRHKEEELIYRYSKYLDRKTLMSLFKLLVHQGRKDQYFKVASWFFAIKNPPKSNQPKQANGKKDELSLEVVWIILWYFSNTYESYE